MAIELRMHDGEAVVAKVRPGVDDARTRLDDERRLLRELDLAGTVTPLDEEVTDEPALLLRPSGTSTLASSAPTPADVRTIGASLADTLLGLHERGVTHGAIEPDHVLWSPGRSPVLCGFGTATREGEPTEDIEALGRLLVALAADDPTIAEAVEGSGGDLRRLRSSLGPSPASGPMLPPAAPRPAGGLPARPIGRERGPRGRWPVVVGAVLLIAALAGIGVLLVGRGSEPSASPPPSTTVTSTTPTTTAPTTTTTPPRAEQVWPAPNDCPAIGLGSGDRLGETDLDADGCPESVVRAGAELVVGDRRFEVGSPEDLVVLGDWDCDGSTTPTLVTATAGAVHPFPYWPDEGPLDVEAVAVLGEASAASVVTSDGCDALVVELADGTTTEVSW